MDDQIVCWAGLNESSVAPASCLERPDRLTDQTTHGQALGRRLTPARLRITSTWAGRGRTRWRRRRRSPHTFGLRGSAQAFGWCHHWPTPLCVCGGACGLTVCSDEGARGCLRTNCVCLRHPGVRTLLKEHMGPRFARERSGFERRRQKQKTAAGALKFVGRRRSGLKQDGGATSFERERAPSNL